MGLCWRIPRVLLLGMIGIVTLFALATTPTTGQSSEEHTAPSLPSRLGALEDRSYEAWKSGDRKFLTTFLSEKFVGWGPSGRADKREAVSLWSGASCRLAGYRLTNQQVTQFTPSVALLTHRTEVDGVCNGKPLSPASYTVTLYVLEQGQWKAAYRSQSAIVNPMKAARPAGSGLWTSGPTRTDAGTQTLLAREQAMVDAWKDHDATRMDKFFGPEIQFVDIFGDHIGSRSEALKTWSGEGCDVKGFNFTGARATMFGPDFGILTYRATYDAKCFGQDVWPIWGTSFYVKHDGVWMWSSGINVLAGSPVA